MRFLINAQLPPALALLLVRHGHTAQIEILISQGDHLIEIR